MSSSRFQTESPSGKDLSLLGEYLLISLVFVFSAMVEFAFVIYLKQIEIWKTTARCEGPDSRNAEEMCSMEMNDVSNDLTNVKLGTRKIGIIQDSDDQESKCIIYWSRKRVMRQGLPLTNKIDFTGMILFYFGYVLFNVVYWNRVQNLRLDNN